MSEHQITEDLFKCAQTWSEMGFEFERTATFKAMKEITRLREAMELAYRQGHDDGWRELEIERGWDSCKKRLLTDEALQESSDD